MKKHVVWTVAPMMILGLIVVSAPWLLAHFERQTDEHFMQDLAAKCVEKGWVASWSIEGGLLGTQTKFSCEANAGSAPAGFHQQ